MLRTGVQFLPGPPKSNLMESVKKFIDEQLNKIDIDRQRELIIKQACEIDKQTEIISKLISEGPDFGFDGVTSTDMDNTIGEERNSSKKNKCQ